MTSHMAKSVKINFIMIIMSCNLYFLILSKKALNSRGEILGVML